MSNSPPKKKKRFNFIKEENNENTPLFFIDYGPKCELNTSIDNIQSLETSINNEKSKKQEKENDHSSLITVKQEPISPDYKNLSPILGVEEKIIEEPWLELDKINAIPNPKGKLLEYFQKSNVPPPIFEISSKVQIGDKIYKSGWYNNSKEAEKQLAIKLLTNLEDISKEMNYISPKDLNLQKSIIEIDLNNSNKNINTTNTTKTNNNKQVIQDNNNYISLNDILLDALLKDSNKKPITIGHPKSILANWSRRLGITLYNEIQVQSKGYYTCKISINESNICIYNSILKGTKKKDIETTISSHIILMFKQLTSFINSKYVYPILIKDTLYKQSSTNTNIYEEYYFDIHEYSNPFSSLEVSKKLNSLINYNKSIKIYFGINNTTKTLVGISISNISLFKNQFYAHLSSWYPKPNTNDNSQFIWNIIPIYTSDDILKGIHYLDIITLEENCQKTQSTSFDISKVIHYALQTLYCIICLEIKPSNSVYCTTDGAFIWENNSIIPIPLNKLSPQQRSFLDTNFTTKLSSKLSSSSSTQKIILPLLSNKSNTNNTSYLGKRERNSPLYSGAFIQNSNNRYDKPF